ncbi:hypothetical protein H6G76_33330 [Nostoc sp. FACHB-152]|uniref:hypothetical protein n=1 Tax=unclassified Nostoc TaxID=2593658 RepID=UPI0016881C39|nr:MULTISPECIES: hypothetical protein [unclassified Nostoc]MBD2451920.1 hypothetical protein [Nostoc sp. FACHB-152]MBD2472424.1 hypothetical protein [Nostoc sp. FACHB-145]
MSLENPSPLAIALTLWNIGLVSEQNLIAWADAQILAIEKPADDLLEIATKDAKVCLKKGLIETLPIALGYSEEFFIRAYLLDIECDGGSHSFQEYRATKSFIAWVAHNCCGSTETPEALLGYHLEHLYCDCEDVDAAIAMLRVELPKIMPRCESFATMFLEQVSGLELCI